MRTESEAIEHELYSRFKSDAEALEAKLADRVRGRPEKLTEEFRSIFDGVPQDGREDHSTSQTKGTRGSNAKTSITSG
jgi:hypothetical protein